jgi:hypothetical protein
MARKAVLIVPLLAMMVLFCRLPESVASDSADQSPQQKGVHNTGNCCA